MRQHVSSEQLKSFPWEEQKKIATAFGQFGNCSRIDGNGEEYLILPMLAERITIGKMIERLNNHTSELSILYQLEVWQAKILIRDEKGEMVRVFCEDEVCDALWRAVQEIMH
jgi:hypothetical protein